MLAKPPRPVPQSAWTWRPWPLPHGLRVHCPPGARVQTRDAASRLERMYRAGCSSASVGSLSWWPDGAREPGRGSVTTGEVCMAVRPAEPRREAPHRRTDSCVKCPPPGIERATEALGCGGCGEVPLKASSNPGTVAWALQVPIVTSLQVTPVLLDPRPTVTA